MQRRAKVEVSAVLDEVLRPPAPSAYEGVEAFFQDHRARAEAAATPWEAAIRGAVRADRLAWAFAAGYEAALWALLPARRHDRPAALCATERGGAHPRAIATRLEGGVLTGEKTFVTFGAHAEELFVLAKVGEGAGGRAELSLLSVPASAAGVEVRPLPALPFVPEIPHASVRLDGVRELDVLEGDGWADYVRPFRTVEDAYVLAAATAWLTASGRRFGFPPEHAERGLSILSALAHLSAADPSAPSTHLSLAGLFGESAAWIAAHEPDWRRAPSDDRARWERDRPLLSVASSARDRRRRRAWERLGVPLP